MFRNSDGQPSSPIGTTYSPGGTAQNPTAITVPDVAAPDRPQTPETPDGTGELRRALREGSAGTDFRGWTRSSLFDSEDPLLGLFARVQRISHILQASVTFVAGPPGTMTVVAVHQPPLSFSDPLPPAPPTLDDPFDNSSPRRSTNSFVLSLLETIPPLKTSSPPPKAGAKRSRKHRSPPSSDSGRKRTLN